MQGKNTHYQDILNNTIHSSHVIIHSFFIKKKSKIIIIMIQNFTFANIDNSNDDPVLVITDLEKKVRSIYRAHYSLLQIYF